MVQLRPHIVGTRDNASTWTEFIVTTSPDGQTLQRNCSGLLIIDYEPPEGSEASRERKLESDSLKHQRLKAAQLCKNNVAPAEFYRELSAMGLIYGPTFANLTEIRSTDGQSFCAVDIPEVSMNVNEGIQHRPHIIHPGTLDAILHMAFVAINGGEHKLQHPMIPRAIDEVVVSANIPYQSGTRLSGYANANKHGFKDFRADIVMLDEEADHPVVKIMGLNCTDIGGSSPASDNDTAAKKICSKLTWKPAIKILSSEEKQVVIKRNSNSVVDDILKRRIGNGEVAALRTIDQVLQAVPKNRVLPSMQKLYAWIQLQRDLANGNAHSLQNILNYASADEDYSGNGGIKAEALSRIGDRIEKLLLGQADITSLSTIQDAVSEVYLGTEGVKVVLAKLTEVGISCSFPLRIWKLSKAVSAIAPSYKPRPGHLRSGYGLW